MEICIKKSKTIRKIIKFTRTSRACKSVNVGVSHVQLGGEGVGLGVGSQVKQVEAVSSKRSVRSHVMVNFIFDGISGNIETPWRRPARGGGRGGRPEVCHPDVGGGVTKHGGGGGAATAVPCVGTCVKPSVKKREH